MHFLFRIEAEKVGLGYLGAREFQTYQKAAQEFDQLMRVERYWTAVNEEVGTRIMNHAHTQLRLCGPCGVTTLRHDPWHEQWWTSRPGIVGVLDELLTLDEDEVGIFDMWCEEGRITEEELLRLRQCFQKPAPIKIDDWLY